MEKSSVFRLGAVCSVLVGLSYVVIGVTQLLLPREYTSENSLRVPLMFFESNRVLFMTQWSAMAWGAVFALAVVPAVSENVQRQSEGWVRWTSTLAMLGFVVTILDNYRSIAMTPAIAAAYRSGSEMTRIAIAVPASAFIDVRGWLGYGAVGLWVLTVSLVSLRGNIWPRPLALLGIAVAVGYLLILAANILPNLSGVVLVVAAIGGVVLGPIWYIWMGLFLYRGSSRPVQKAQTLPVGQL